MLTWVLFLCSLSTMFAQYSGSGTGTQNDPYLIFNEIQLSQMANFLNQPGVYFELKNDLDLTDWIAENNPSQGWNPVGVQDFPFMGVLLGDNHKISGLKISRSQQDFVGFFGYLDGATIKDVAFEGTSVEGDDNVGAFCGYAKASTISNVTVTMESIKGSCKVGTVAGYAKASTISNVTVTMESIKGSGNVGTVAGSLERCTISNITSTNGNTQGSSSIGGFAGEITGTTIKRAIISGDISGTAALVGGFVGLSDGSTITDAKTTGNIIGQAMAGGFAGKASGTNAFTNCRHIGTLSGTTSVGGIVGYLDSASTNTFTSCMSKERITATGNYVGGIVGNSQGGSIAKMESCSHFGDISGGSRVGGLIGAQENVTTEPTLSKWEIKSGRYSYSTVYETNYDCITNDKAVSLSINNCTAIGNIQGGDYIGGLIGYEEVSIGYESHPNAYKYNGEAACLWRDGRCVDGSYRNTINYGTIYTRDTCNYALTNSYYSGTINGKNNVGGLVGYKIGGIIQNNYTYGSIYGEPNVGGIVGYTSGESNSRAYVDMVIKSNAAINNVVSATKSDVGRIYGKADHNHLTIGALGSAEGNKSLAQTRIVLSDVEQEITDDDQNGNSIGQSSLKLKATYVSWGWDFDNKWAIQETECYPYKKYQAAPPVIESDLVSQAIAINGKSLNGGTVYLYYKNRDAVSTTCNGNQWSFTTEPLQSGATVQIYADVEDMTPSYFTTTTVKYPGSGTEDDPYCIYTAEDLQGASNRGYYKLMNNIDLTSWINQNSPSEGWVPIGRNSGESTYIDGNGHKVSGLWINSDKDYTGLFSNFSAGQIKNLDVEVARGKSVKGGNYTGILIGRIANGRIVNCSVNGDAEGTLRVGGLAGYAVNTTLGSLRQDGKVTSNTDNASVGGLVGEASSGSITKSVSNATLNVSGKDSRVGGLVGKSSSEITLAVSKGSVTCSGEGSWAGGLVGYSNAPISNSYSTAEVSGTEYTAGLVGYSFSTIDKCYAKGDVKGISYGAGVVGELDGPSASLTNSVAVNNILSLTAQTSWGSRVIGGYKNGSADPVKSNYALSTMQVSLNAVPQKKKDNLVEGIAKPESELMQSATYMGIGWDFSKVWGIDEGSIFPYLLWEVDVNPVADITLDKTSVILPVGKNDTISASVLPLGATNKRIEWKSGNTAVATVADGIVTAVAVGEAVVTATSTDGSNISATCKVTVVENKDAAIAKLQALVDKALSLYNKSTEGSEIGQYAPGSRAVFLKVINAVKAKISDTMSDEDISQGTTDLQNAIDTFESKKVTAGADTDISKLNTTVYIENLEARSGTTATLPVKMKNNFAVQGLQFDLYLPEGITFAKDADGMVDATLSTERTTTRKTDLFSFAIQPDGALRVVIASTSGYTFDGSDGEIAKIKVNVADGLANGDYPLIFKKVEISSHGKEYEKQSYVKSTLTVSSYKLGDVNADGDITIRDIITTSQYILGENPSPFIFAAADVSGDNEITIRDMVGISNLILGSTTTVGKLAPIIGQNATGTFSMPEFVLDAGDVCNVGIDLANNFPVVGYQFDVSLPEGVELQGISNSEQRVNGKSSNIIDFAKLNNGNYRVLFCSTNGQSILGNAGSVLNLKLTAQNEMMEGCYDLTISNIEIAGKSYAVQQDGFMVPFQIGKPTFIKSLGVDAGAKVNVYNVNGVAVRTHVKAGESLKNLPKGVYIINGKKIVK